MLTSGAIGIHIGGSKTLCLLVDERYKVIAKKKFKTAPAKGRKRCMRALCNAVTELCTVGRKEGLRLAGIGIACAGTIDAKNVVVKKSNNIPWMHNFALGALLKKVSRLRCVVGNDVHLGLM